MYKKEFDICRKNQTPHRLFEQYGLNHFVPFQHPEIDKWRDSMHHGLSARFGNTNIMLFGGVDDVWINTDDELHIVDYKATAKKTFNPNFDTGWEVCYKRQIEIYQWLFRKNGFKVSDIGYIIYANGKSDEKEFNKNLSFEEYLFPLACNTDWVDEIIKEIYQCLNSEKLPKSGGGWNGEGCEQCLYKKKLFDIFKAHTSN